MKKEYEIPTIILLISECKHDTSMLLYIKNASLCVAVIRKPQCLSGCGKNCLALLTSWCKQKFALNFSYSNFAWKNTYIGLVAELAISSLKL